MRVLVVQNYDKDRSRPGRRGAGRGGRRNRPAPRPSRRALPEDAGGHDAIVVLGGGQNALADDDYPYFRAAARLMRDFSRQTGRCSASASAASSWPAPSAAQNRIGGASEFGWRRIVADARRRGRSGAAARCRQQFPIFQWHDDTFSLPARRRAAGRQERSPRTRRSASAAPPTASSSISRRTGRWSGTGTRLRRPDRRAPARLAGPLRQRSGPQRRRGRCRRPGHRPRLGGHHLSSHRARPWHNWHGGFLRSGSRFSSLALPPGSA